ncbi:Flp pilus assembly protein CpaB [Streptomyces sp. TRM 70361]|uniref:Flp pilus assembly protein CpaB n=1 Tax=Streptomyces sp. TRM 70361 TaxID=3116553 RepID=UPI002E7ADB96|nr:Flp pilus assembly protein CpaB [Streptomyces sp. TRM 70361]MEE1939286.1 Flp pilus assembly protein CpaB [Streptomyces sp. TRM 70361]
MNSRQRRGVILLLLSVLCALVAFGGVLSVINDVESKVGPEVTAYRLAKDVPAYQVLDEEAVERISIPERWLSDTALTDLDDIEGKIAANRLRKGSLLQSGMVAEQPELKPGEQEIAIMIDAATGVAGKISPESRVNIYATFRDEEGDEETEVSRVIVDNARVVDVGRLTPISRADDRDGRRGDRDTEAVPITFALSTLDAQRVAFAESFAVNVRLALVAPGDTAEISEQERNYTLTGDK